MTNLALMQPARTRHWAPEFLQRVKNELSQPRLETQPISNFRVVDDVGQADIVLYLESTYKKNVSDLADYRNLLEWAVKHHKMIFTLSFEDRPLGALPGIYTSTNPQNFDPSLHLSWPHLEPPNKEVDVAALRPPEQSKYLFSFAGSCSHRLRRQLFPICKTSNQSGISKVYEVDRWYDHSEKEQQQYVNDILDCRFALCPRGIAAYSHRIIETILLNRVPVIIADDWVPFSFPVDNYYVRVPEKNIANIHSILQHELKNYDTYYANLLKLKSTWLAKSRRYQVLVEEFLKFQGRNQRAHHPRVLLERLASNEFLKSNGLLTHQRLLQNLVRIPEHGEKVLRRIMSSHESLNLKLR